MRRRRFLFLFTVLTAAFFAVCAGPARADDAAGKAAAPPPSAKSARDLPDAAVFRYEVCDGQSRRIAEGAEPSAACMTDQETFLPAGPDPRGQADAIVRRHTGIDPGKAGGADEPMPAPAPVP